MSKNLLNKYVWLVNTIYNAKRIPFKEINKKWVEEDMSEGGEIPERTFHKWRHVIEDMFGINIECENRGNYSYYIENEDDITSGGFRNWLLKTVSVSNLLLENQKKLKNRILLEEIPSGQEFLPTILNAMKKNTEVKITYQNFQRNDETTFPIQPYCVKLFKQRWYLLAYNSYFDDTRIYAFDRIHDVQLTKETFRIPKDFDATEYFENFYGICVNDNMEPEIVRLKVSGGQENYVRTLPLHKSQKEIERNEDYSIFELRMCPEFDFQQEILSQTPDVEVLEPAWLRDEIARKVNILWNKYNK